MSNAEQAAAAKLLLKALRVLRPFENTLGPELRALVEELEAFVDTSKTPAPEAPR